jgi:hypothetical protein
MKQSLTLWTGAQQEQFKVISNSFTASWSPNNPGVKRPFDWHTGFPFSAVNDNQQVVGPAGSLRFPTISPLAPGSNGGSTSADLISVCEAFWKMPPAAGTP